MRDFEAKRLLRRVTNHASRGQEVRDEVRACDRAPQTARSDVLKVAYANNISFAEYQMTFWLAALPSCFRKPSNSKQLRCSHNMGNKVV